MATNGNGTHEPQEASEPQGGQPSGGLFGLPNRWLLIGGGVGGGVLVVVIAVVVVALVLSGGSRIPSNYLGFVPEDSTFITIWDVEVVIDGDVPRNLERSFENFYEYRLDEVGVSTDELETLVYVEDSRGEDSLVIAKGDFDFEDIRDELDDLDYEDDKYRDYEIWEDGDGNAYSISLLGDDEYVLIGYTRDSVQDVLKAVSRERGLVAGRPDHNVNRVMDKVGTGWLIAINSDCQTERLIEIRGCEAIGAAFTDGDRDSASVRMVVLLRSESAANRALDDVEDHIDDHGLLFWNLDSDLEDIDTDREFIVVETISYFDDF